MRALALFALLAAGTASAQTPEQPASMEGVRDRRGEERMLRRINALRREASLTPLLRDDGLDAAAQVQSADMSVHEELTHVSERTGDPAQRIREAGVRTTRIAENIASGASTRDALASILESDAHRFQLLDEGFTHIGLAAVRAEGDVYVTQVLGAIHELEVSLPPPAVADTPDDGAVSFDDSGEFRGDPLGPPPPSGLGGQPEASSLPSMRLPARRHRVAGYWLYQSDRWWYFPVPPNAPAGAVIYPDPSVEGPPPGYRPRHNPPRAMPAPPPPARYRIRVQTRPRGPAWRSPRRQGTILWY